jgi:uncharacterized protein (DUF2225 family)
MFKMKFLEEFIFNKIEMYSDDVVMECPVCGLKFNQFVNVYVNAGGNIVGFDSDGIKQMEGEATGRGTSVFITFVCEQGHYWVLQFQFHKGMVHYNSYSINKNEINNRKRLWRD